MAIQVGATLRTNLCLILGFLLHGACSLNVFSRSSTLRAWGTGTKLGEVVERRVEKDHLLEVTARWLCQDEDKNDVVVKLVDFTDNAYQGLGSSLWESSLAGSILLCSPEYRSALQDKSVLELGSGLGLAGFVAATAPAKSLILSDKDEESVKALTETIGVNADAIPCGDMTAKCLEWRDPQVDVQPVDFVLGTDVAYYHHLLRPLMDTAQAHMAEDGILCILGQANRQSQWDLYSNIKNGCYNQLSDAQDPPWPGETKMVLYDLEVGSWCSVNDDSGIDEKPAGVLQIGVILHSGNKEKLSALLVSEHAHISTRDDEAKQAISF